jgi:hypothetical protein
MGLQVCRRVSVKCKWEIPAKKDVNGAVSPLTLDISAIELDQRKELDAAVAFADKFTMNHFTQLEERSYK